MDNESDYKELGGEERKGCIKILSESAVNFSWLGDKNDHYHNC